MSELLYERVQSHLDRLNLGRMADHLDTLSQQAAKEQWTYLQFLDHLLDREVAARYERDVAMKTKLAHFPFAKTLAEFDFAFQPSIPERQVRELATMRFVANGENLLLLGPPGVGKTHLAIALGMAAIAQSMSVYFLTVADLIDLLHEDAQKGRLAHRLHTLAKPKLLILDEMGYFPLDRMAAQFLFQLVSRRYLKGSIILTSNKSFADWGDIFADQVLATAILDRLLHHATTLNIRGQSFRLRERRKTGLLSEPASPQKEA
jgi:DNA replication protein DnaC